MAKAQQVDDQQDLENLLDGIIQLGKGQSEISVDDIQREIGQRSFGPFLFVIGVCEISPIGGIPGLPTLLALMVAIFSIQMLLGRESLWLPAFLSKRSIESDKVASGLNDVRPLVRWIDKLVHPRLTWTSGKQFVRLIAMICIVLTLSVPPLELVPFASTIPFSAICLFGLGLAAKDGLVILLGAAVSLGAIFLALSQLVGG